MNFFTIFLFLFSLTSVAAPYDEIGIAPDCSENKVSIGDLLAIEKQPEIDNAIDFLNAIPEKSMQTFTFVHDSNSFQHHLVDKKWPRVLRTTADGKVTLSFVCNPNSQDYDRIEILHYVDPPVATWQSVSIDFRKQKLSYGDVGEDEASIKRQFSRVSKNELTCAKCHSESGENRNDIKPIFAQYKTWTGFYGSDDDVVHPGTEEYDNYKDFLAHAKNDPCFSTLPWPKSNSKEYELYPYHEGFDVTKTDLNNVSISQETQKIKTRNYHLRPNLKFTDAYSHRMAQRLAWKLLKNADYSKVAPLLMMEAVNCNADVYTKELEKTIPGYKSPEGLYLHTYMDPRSESSRTKNLYAMSLHLGLSTADYNLHFNDAQKAYYNTGAAGENQRDTSIARMAQGVLMQELAKSFPELKEHFTISRAVSKFFSPQDFSCIDDIAGHIYIETIDHKKVLCKKLKSIHSSARRTENFKSANFAARPLETWTSSQRQSLFSKLKQQHPKDLSRQSINRGHDLLYNCVGCHGEDSYLPKSYQFLASEERLDEEIKKYPQFAWRVLAYLENKRMPKGANLSKNEVLDLQAYFLSRLK